MVADSRVGTVIEDKYRLDEQIGQGSMGAVFRGTQLMVDRSVAIKLLHPNFAGHDKIQARFEVEAKAIARLNHPNCITLFDFGYADDMEAFYTVVEFIDGKPLEALIDERPSEVRVVELMKQIASALGHAHHHGILHRDLKPENIMLASMTDGSEMVKVLDFGIAQIMQGGTEDEFESDRLTRVGEVFGTPPYMSPEQAQSARDLTPATDLYSLGIIFYELLTGRLPFFGESPVEIMTKHMEEPPPPIDDPRISTAVEEVVMQMLAKDPEERPEGGDRIVAMLDAIPDDELSTTSRSAARVAGEADQGETLLEMPPDQTGPQSTRITVDDPSLSDTDHDTDHQDDPAEKSAILELTDLAPPPSSTSSADAESEPNPQPSDSDEPPTEHASRSMEEAAPTQNREALTSTQMIDPGEEQALAAEASRLAWAQRRSTALIVVASIAVLGLLAWVLVEYQPFSMTGEESMGRAGEMADYQPQGSAEVPSEPDDGDADDPDVAPPPPEGVAEPRQVSIGDEPTENAENADDGDEEDDFDDEEDSQDDATEPEEPADDPPPPAPPRPPPPPARAGPPPPPPPAPGAAGSQPDPQPPPSIDEPTPQPQPEPEPSESDDSPQGPPRLDL